MVKMVRVNFSLFLRIAVSFQLIYLLIILYLLISNLKDVDEDIPSFLYRAQGSYHVLYNYFEAADQFSGNESITFVTQGDFTHLHHLITICDAWQGPISVAVFAPRDDFAAGVLAAKWLRQCSNGCIANLVTFHFFYPRSYEPKTTWYNTPIPPVHCHGGFPWKNKKTYMQRLLLEYPINVARNIARERAATHFILSADIEMYPSKRLIPRFLAMMNREMASFASMGPTVFVLPAFEVEEGEPVPNTKYQLMRMWDEGKVFSFHSFTCPVCHEIPGLDKWLTTPVSDVLSSLMVVKRGPELGSWEPVFIGTHHDPLFDTRLTWDGHKDKIMLAYILCLLDYNFAILDGAFLLHSPGVKRSRNFTNRRWMLIDRQNQYIRSTIVPEYHKVYPYKESCLYEKEYKDDT